MSRVWVLVLTVLAYGCVYPTPKSVSSTYVYVELLKSKVGASEADTEAVLADMEDLLLPIPAVKGFWVGRPIPGAPTTEYVLDDDYDVGMVLLFDSPRGFQAFRDHPAFVEFRSRHGDKWSVRALNFSPFSGPPRP